MTLENKPLIKIKNEKFLKFTRFNTKFQYSSLYYLILILISTIGFGVEVEGRGILVVPAMSLLALVLSYNMIACRDIMPSVLTVILIAVVPVSMYDSRFEDYIIMIPFAIIFLITFVARFIIYPVKFKKSKFFYFLLCYSVAMFLGGIGSGIYFAQFNKFTCFYTMIGLGFLPLFLYVMWQTYVPKERNGELTIKFAKMMTVLLFIIISFYAISYLKNIPNFINDGFELLRYQWKNNTGNILLLTVPFAFYLANISKHRIFYFVLGVVAYGVMMISQCSGAIIFGTIITPVLVIYCIVKASKKYKFIFLAIVAVFAILIGIIVVTNLELFKFLVIDKSMSGGSSRVNLYEEAVRMFIRNPLTGMGFAYENPNVNPALPFGLFYIHSTFFQHLGAQGILGVLTYFAMALYRLKILIGRLTPFNFYITIGFLGFAGYSMVNTGMCSPLPFVMLCTFFVLICEEHNESVKKRKELVEEGYDLDNEDEENAEEF